MESGGVKDARRSDLDWLTEVRSSLLLRFNIQYMNFTGTSGSSLMQTTILYTETVLNKNHYRLTDVESRIPKLSVGKLRRTRGQIIHPVDPLSASRIGRCAARCRRDYGP